MLSKVLRRSVSASRGCVARVVMQTRGKHGLALPNLVRASSKSISAAATSPTSAFTTQRPEDVGVVAIDSYFPRYYCDQTELEQHDGVGAGKYTIGLGQQEIAFVDDTEDVYSLSLSAVSQFMEKNGLSYNDIGRLEVASETILDHSKSIKTYLMQLFEESGNADVEGIDSLNACYAGTNALFNSVAWCESSAWDGRYALVVSVDIAEYAAGPARPTGGAGAVVYLVGPKAPLVMEPARGSYMSHVYDFYKPNLTSPYPVVDGKFSNICYVQALDQCYQRFTQKWAVAQNAIGDGSEPSDFAVSDADYAVFHAPYNGLVKKSYARLRYNDFLRFPEDDKYADLRDQFGDVSLEDSYTNKPLEKALVAAMKDDYEAKVAPTTYLPRRIGNTYTASMYAGLLSLFCTQPAEELADKRVLCFSYGSGLASSMFTMRFRGDAEARDQITRVRDTARLQERLDNRIKKSPEEYNRALDSRATKYASDGAFQPSGSVDDLFSGAYHLVAKEADGKRTYQKRQ